MPLQRTSVGEYDESATSWHSGGLILALFRYHLRTSVPIFNMVYNWDGKEAECYRLYVQEKRSLDEVLAYWEQRGFTPRYVSARTDEQAAVIFGAMKH